MKTIKLTLIKSLIIESVKNETYQKGQVDKASKENASALAFHEQAGDESHHLRMLQRGMYTAYADLQTQLSTYLSDSGSPVGDNLIETEETEDNFKLLLQVSDRFNDGYTNSLALLCSKYIEESMLVDWWKPIDKEKAATYLAFQEKDLAGIRRCFNKRAPHRPVYHFPTAITLKYPVLPELNGCPGWLNPDEAASLGPNILFGNPWHIGVGDHTDISYTLTGENEVIPIDDILVRCDDICCKPSLNNDGEWRITGVSTGYCIVTLYSRHNDRVFAKFAVRVV